MNTIKQQPLPITDSPWFWFALFTAVGFSALMATGGKFGKRQAGIERKYQAREWVNEKSGKQKVGSGNVALDTAKDASNESPPKIPEYSTPKKTLIPIWPLVIILGLLCAGSVTMLLRERFHGTQPDRNAIHGMLGNAIPDHAVPDHDVPDHDVLQ